MVDIRTGSVAFTNKRHQAGVTFLYKPDDISLMTGSYDSTIRLWDERMLKSEIDSLDLSGKSVWDVKFSKDFRQMGIASIYDGYHFSKTSEKPIFSEGFKFD